MDCEAKLIRMVRIPAVEVTKYYDLLTQKDLAEGVRNGRWSEP